MFTFHVMDLTALRQGEVGGAVHGGVGGHSVVVSAVTLKEGHYTRTWEEGGTTSTHQDMGGGRDNINTPGHGRREGQHQYTRTWE